MGLKSHFDQCESTVCYRDLKNNEAAENIAHKINLQFFVKGVWESVWLARNERRFQGDCSRWYL